MKWIFAILFLVSLIAFSASAKDPVCVGVAAPESAPKTKGIDELPQGIFVEFRYQTDLHENAVKIRGKYLGYSNGLIVKYLQNNTIHYGTFNPSDILGRPEPMSNEAQAKALEQTMNEIQGRWEREEFERLHGRAYPR